MNRLYIPAAASGRAISASSYAPARELAEWKKRLHDAWPRVQVLHVESGGVDVVPQLGDIPARSRPGRARRAQPR
ncbi:MAG: hypothetical protein WDM88_11870 [Galbitalea sp.]